LSDAYRKAYSTGNMKASSINVNASQLMADTKVAQRVAELRKPVIEKMHYDLEQAMKEAQEAFEVSKSKENGGAMVAAVTLRSKLNGLLVEKKEITVNAVSEMSDVDLQKFIQRKAQEAGLTLH